jgi:hypothetical protein
MTELRLPENLRRVPHLAQRRLGDEVIVMDMKEGRLYGFNPAAGALLDWLKPGRQLDGEKLERVGLSAVVVFVAELERLGMIERVGDFEPGSEPPVEQLPELAGEPPRLLWQEEAVRVTNQTSPPQAITNPQCQP